MKENEFISYIQVQEIIGVDPTDQIGYSISTQARKIVTQEHDIVIDCIRKEGFKRVDDPEKIRIGRDYVTKMRRTVKRGERVVNATNYEKLNGSERVQYTLIASWLGALDQATKPTLAKEIVQVIEQSSNIQCGDVLTLVISKGQKKRT